VLAVVARMELDLSLRPAVEALRRAGWRVVVASAGCAWYIDRLLAAVGVELDVFANPGRFEAGKGLVMEMPPPSAYRSPTLGVDKAGLVSCGTPH
jgi:phosphoserine phosphatase